MSLDIMAAQPPSTRCGLTRQELYDLNDRYYGKPVWNTAFLLAPDDLVRCKTCHNRIDEHPPCSILVADNNSWAAFRYVASGLCRHHAARQKLVDLARNCRAHGEIKPDVDRTSIFIHVFFPDDEKALRFVCGLHELSAFYLGVKIDLYGRIQYNKQLPPDVAPVDPYVRLEDSPTRDSTTQSSSINSAHPLVIKYQAVHVLSAHGVQRCHLIPAALLGTRHVPIADEWLLLAATQTFHALSDASPPIGIEIVDTVPSPLAADRLQFTLKFDCRRYQGDFDYLVHNGFDYCEPDRAKFTFKSRVHIVAEARSLFEETIKWRADCAQAWTPHCVGEWYQLVSLTQLAPPSSDDDAPMVVYQYPALAAWFKQRISRKQHRSEVDGADDDTDVTTAADDA